MISSKFRRSTKILRLFAGFILEIGWYKVRRAVWGDKVERYLPQLYRNQAIRFRETALSLEGLLIKVGQFFSTRVDVLPLEYTSELAKLQDEVPAVTTKEIRDVIQREFGQSAEELFAHFDDHPIAAASLGQVHRAILPSGETVAVKTLRPGIEKIIDIDLQAFRGVIWMLKIFTNWEKYADLDAIYDEFAVTLREELDFTKEANNIERFRQNFKDESKIYVPLVYERYSTQRVLTMEFVSGYKINDLRGLRQAGINVKELANNLVNAYLKQTLLDGFYHADPHPGNLFVRPDGGIIFIDFGMVGRITEENKKSVRKLVSGLINSDAEEMTTALLEMGFIKADANLLAIQRAIGLLVSQLKDINFEEIGNLDIAPLLEEAREFIYTEPFQIPANYSFLGRAVGILSGVAAGLDPELNALEIIKPYGKKLLGQDFSASRLAWNKVKTAVLSGLDTPPLLNKSLRQLNSGEVQVKFETGPILRQLRFQQTLANRLMWTILLAATGIIEAMFLVTGHDDWARQTLYVLAGLGLLLLNNLRKKAEKDLQLHFHTHKHNKS